MMQRELQWVPSCDWKSLKFACYTKKLPTAFVTPIHWLQAATIRVPVLPFPVVWATMSSSSTIVGCFIASWRRLSQWHLIFGHWHIPELSLQEIVGRDKIFDQVFRHILLAIHADLSFNFRIVQWKMKIWAYTYK